MEILKSVIIYLIRPKRALFLFSLIVVFSSSNTSLAEINNLEYVDGKSKKEYGNFKLIDNIQDQLLTNKPLNYPIMIPKGAPQFPIEIGPFQLKDNGKTRFYVENGMMRERTHDSGDNLWRTSIAYIAYTDSAMKDGMLRCTKWISPNHVQYYRSFEQTDMDVSRDQVIMFLSAMALSGEDVSKYIKATKLRLSKRFNVSVTMWLWMKALAGNKFAQKMYFFIQIPKAKMYLLWNKSGISNFKFPAYANHLLAWQIYTLNDDTKYQKSLSDLVMKMADEDNYLIRLLLDLPVSKEQVENVKPTTDFKWQRNKSERAKYCRELTPEEAEFNTIDVDILKAIFSKSCYKNRQSAGAVGYK